MNDGDITLVVTLQEYDTIQAALEFWARKGAGFSLLCGERVVEPEVVIAQQHGEIALSETAVRSLRGELDGFHQAQVHDATPPYTPAEITNAQPPVKAEG